MTKEEQAREAWEEFYKESFTGTFHAIADQGAVIGKDKFQSRLLEELEKRRESILTKMASLDNNGEHYQVDHDDYTAELVSCDEIIELVKTIKPLKNYGTRNYQ